jgi:hypothetical protein
VAFWMRSPSIASKSSAGRSMTSTVRRRSWICRVESEAEIRERLARDPERRPS